MNETRFSLDLIQVASPCHVSWDEMAGDERVRHCGQCKLSVYNLGEMSRQEAEDFINRREGRMCVRFYRRQDGTVLTKDCPVGVRALKQRMIRAVAALAGIFVAMFGAPLLGGVLNRLKGGGIDRPAQAFAHWVDPQPKLMIVGQIMGGLSPPVLIPPTAPPPNLDPAETPLLPPTPEQLHEIQQRLEQ